MKALKPAKMATAPEKDPMEGAADALVDETKPMKSISDIRKVYKQKFGPKRKSTSSPTSNMDSANPFAKGKKV